MMGAEHEWGTTRIAGHEENIAESGPSGPVGSLQHYCASVRVCVCVSVCSLHKFMSFKQQFEWRLHVTSRPKLLARSCPVVVDHSLPTSWFRFSPCASPFTPLLSARASISWVVVAHSVPGRLNRFDCSLELACQVCWFLALFMQA